MDQSLTRESSRQERKRFQVTRHIFIENLEEANDSTKQRIGERKCGRENEKQEGECGDRRRNSGDSDHNSHDRSEGESHQEGQGQTGRRVSWADELVTVHEFIKDKKTFRWQFACIPIRLSL